MYIQSLFDYCFPCLSASITVTQANPPFQSLFDYCFSPMALEAAIYSQDPFGYPPLFKDHYGYGFQQEEEEEEEDGALGIMFNDSIATFFNPPPPQAKALPESTSVAPARRKRRRTKNTKNKEEIESQRMTHIAVERNRRKQMNEYLALLRSLMPSSYAQRGHQASIIGGAINYVKELEQLLQAMEAQKAANYHQQHTQKDDGQAELTDNGRLPSPLFSEFFAFPQYSTRNRTVQAQSPRGASGDGMAGSLGGGVAREAAAVGEIEVTMAESHSNVKILARKQQRQLVKLVAGLQSLGFTVLHLNVTTTTSDQMVLYTVSFKVEEGCYLNTVDEIAAAVNQMLRRIEEGC